jgi:hypothetical protein
LFDWRLTVLSRILKCRVFSIAEQGFEHPPNSSEKPWIQEQGGAESGARNAREEQLDPDLAAIVNAWPELPAAIRAGILAMIRAD